MVQGWNVGVPSKGLEPFVAVTWLTLSALGTKTPPGPAIHRPDFFKIARALVTDFVEQEVRFAISAIGMVQNPLANSTASIITRATASTVGVVVRRPVSARLSSRCVSVQNPGFRHAARWLAG